LKETHNTYKIKKHYNKLIQEELKKQEVVFKNSWKWRIGSIFVEFIVLCQNIVKSPLKIKQHFRVYYNTFQKIKLNGTFSTGIEEVINTKFNFSAGVILDEFSYDCFKFEFQAKKIYPSTIRTESIEDWKFLLVESAWRGNNNTWTGKIGSYLGNYYTDLKYLIKRCNSLNIPTIFWNKEDPIHYAHFLKAAKLFDIVLTTDSESIPNYKKDLAHEYIYAMPFAAQPKLHFKNNLENRKNKICFAGSYWNNKYHHRNLALEEMLTAAKPYGLDIYDRNFYRVNNWKEYQFPDKFHEHIVGNLSYEETCDAYRDYRMFINVNSVTASPTMISRRVFELLASGTPILSNPTNAIQNLFPKDLIQVYSDIDELSEILESMMTDDTKWESISKKGSDFITKNYTYTHRVNFILDILEKNMI